jgi:hypothetical protein
LAWSAGLAALVALAAWEGTLDRQSAAAHWSVAAVIAAAIVVTVVAGRSHQRTTSRVWLASSWRSAASWRERPVYAAGVGVWVVVVLAVVGWDVTSFVAQAHDLPTLSYFVGRVTRYEWGRAAVFAAWLAVGGYLAVGWRRGRAR